MDRCRPANCPGPSTARSQLTIRHGRGPASPLGMSGCRASTRASASFSEGRSRHPILRLAIFVAPTSCRSSVPRLPGRRCCRSGRLLRWMNPPSGPPRPTVASASSSLRCCGCVRKLSCCHCHVPGPTTVATLDGYLRAGHMLRHPYPVPGFRLRPPLSVVTSSRHSCCVALTTPPWSATTITLHGCCIAAAAPPGICLRRRHSATLARRRRHAEQLLHRCYPSPRPAVAAVASAPDGCKVAGDVLPVPLVRGAG